MPSKRKTDAMIADANGPSFGVPVTFADHVTLAAGKNLKLDSSGSKLLLAVAVIASADRTLTLPDPGGADSVAYLALAQTFTNKTLTSPVINTPTMKMSNSAKTADFTVTAALTGTTFTTAGAGGNVTFAMPAAVVGLKYRFMVGAAHELRIDPNETETIALPSTGVQGAAGKYLVADAVGESVDVECCVAGTWTVFGYTGTWTAES